MAGKNLLALDVGERRIGLAMADTSVRIAVPAAALGGVGATTNLLPAFTLGCGTVGGSATSDNIGPLNLINIRRVAYGTKELEELKEEGSCVNTCSVDNSRVNENEIEDIIRKVLDGIIKK